MEDAPDREAAVADIAERLGEGRTLTGRQIGELLVTHGYSAKTVVTEVTKNVKVVQALAQQGVELVVERYRRSDIYRDGKLPVDQTDLEATKQRLDLAEEQRLDKIRKA